MWFPLLDQVINGRQRLYIRHQQLSYSFSIGVASHLWVTLRYNKVNEYREMEGVRSG